MLISIDHGNYSIKSSSNSIRSASDTFVAGLSEHTVQPPLASDIIEYNGRYWTLTGSRLAYMRDKTRDERYFVLTLFAVVKELQLHGSLPAFVNIDIAAGLPPEHFSVLKDKFTKYLRREAVMFVYNGTPICLSIRRVLVYPQAYAAGVPRNQLLENTPRVFIVNVGGYTIDILLLRNGKPDLQFCRSIEVGVITLNNEIIGKVGARHDLRIEDDQIASVIQGEETILPAGAIETILESAKNHADKILDKLRELQVDLRSTPAIFIGGGSILFRPYIENSSMVVKAEFISDPKANAIGYGMLAAGQMKHSEGVAGEN